MAEEIVPSGDGLADDLRATVAALSAEPEPVVTPEVQAPVDKTSVALDTRDRDQQGRFKPKDATAPVEPVPVTEAKAPDAKPIDPTKPLDAKPTETPTELRLAPPPGWSVKSKTDYAALPQHIKDDIAKREAEVSNGFKQYSDKVKAYEGIEQIIGPRRESIREAGLDDTQAINMLFAASEALDNDPERAIAVLAQNHGVNIMELAQKIYGGQQPAGQQPGNQTLDDPNQSPIIRGLIDKVNELQSHLTAQQRQEQAIQDRDAGQQLTTFSNDPKNVYFENVRKDMGFLIKSGRANTLEDAYQQACWAHPEIREALIKEKVASDAAQRAAEAKAKTDQARRAGASLIGAPGPGGGPTSSPQDNLRNEVAAAFSNRA